MNHTYPSQLLKNVAIKLLVLHDFFLITHYNHDRVTLGNNYVVILISRLLPVIYQQQSMTMSSINLRWYHSLILN